MANELPIIIGSDEEDSDSDDVVLIKEEIEVEEDNDDVIFLSETKPSPQPESEPKDRPELAHRSLSVPSQGSNTAPALNRSISITTCTGRLALDDNQDPGIQCDTLPLLSNMVNASGPLDLSSKSSDTIQSPMCVTCDTDITGSNVTQDSTVDTASVTVSAVLQGSDGCVTVNTTVGNVDNTVADTIKTSQCSDTSFQSCSVSGSPGTGMTSSSLSLSVGSYTDVTVLPGGFMANTALLPQLDNTVNSASSIFDTNISDLSSSKYYRFPMPNGPRLTTTIPITEKMDTSFSLSANSENAKVPVSSNDAMDTSNQKTIDTKPPLCTDKQSESQASCSGLDSISPTGANPAVTSIQSSALCGNVTDSVAGTAGSDLKTNTESVTCSQAGHVSASTSQFSGDLHNATTSLSSDTAPCASTAPLDSLPVSISSSGVVSVSSCASGTDTTSIAIASSSISCAMASNSQTSSVCDPFSTSHFLISSLNPVWSTYTSCSNIISPSASSSVITSPHISLPVNNSADSTVIQSVNGVTGLPGGSSSFLPGQQQNATNAISSATDVLSQSQGFISNSNSAFNVSDSNRLYNPLTLPIYMQNQQLKHSLSLSALSNHTKSSETLCKRQFSFPRTTPLPPKKQKRCYSDGNSKCANCAVTLIGEKFSRCPNGHTACAKCLEEKVKLLLTGKAKESVRCLDRLCDSFYPVSELKLSLPSIVVEILEDKLDQEYVDYISDMMLKNASGDTDQPSTSGDTEKERYQEYKRDESFPDNWSSMDENVIQKKGYVLIQLEADTPEYEDVVLKFFQSMIDQNVEVTSVHRVQNPIQWKYYCVKKSEIEQDNDGFALERQLFHGTSSTVVDSICRRGFDWRVCGKHGTLYGQGSYFAVNASYSHQYTDLKPPRHLSSSMMLSNPMSMTLPTTPSLIYPPVNINFGQPLNSLTFTALNLSHNATTPTSNASAGSAFQSIPSPVIQKNSSAQTNVSLGQGCLAPIGGPSQNSSSSQRPSGPMRFKVIPNKPAAIRTLVGHPSGALIPSEGQENTKTSARVFLARVLVGRIVKGHAKLRKPPPLYPRQDPFGKCYDSCVDEPRCPKIFVIFDSAQAYPEYLLEYTFSTE